MAIETLQTNRNHLAGIESGQYSRLMDQGFLRKISSTKGGYGQKIETSKASPAYVESLYIGCTDGLIGIIDGSIDPDNEDEHVSNEAHYTHSEYSGPANHVVYLDKSARPVSFLVDELWDLLARPGLKEPEKSYVNIDKEDWLLLMGVPATRLQNPRPADYGLAKIPPSVLLSKVRELRALYVSDEFVDHIDPNRPESVDNLPTSLDGTNVLIVDEVESSGYTLKVAFDLFKKAFPKANFGTAYWASPSKVRWEVSDDSTYSAEFAASWVPFWYSSDTSRGRGIGDINPDFYANATDIRQRMGRFLLSAPFYNINNGEYVPYTDEDSIETYRDLELLTERFRQGKVLLRPNSRRSDFKERATQLNGYSDFNQYLADLRKS